MDLFVLPISEAAALPESYCAARITMAVTLGVALAAYFIWAAATGGFSR